MNFSRPDAPICDSIQLKYSACNKHNSFHVSLIFILGEVSGGQSFHINVAISWFFTNITSCYSTMVTILSPRCRFVASASKELFPRTW